MLTQALPVAVRLTDPDLQADVTAYVEAHLGWQVIDHGPYLPARLCLSDRVHADVPTVGIASGGTDPRPMIRAGALDVVVWPDEAGRLPRLVPPPVIKRPADQIITVVGLAPRVGTTTVTLTVGAVQAWRGYRTTVVTDAAGCQLAGPLTDDHVDGVAGLRVRTSVDHAADPPPDVLVIDRGVGSRGHVAVGVPDGTCARRLTDLHPEGVVVLRGKGGMHAGEITRLAAGRQVVRVEESFRVARAGLRARIPVGLPGSFVTAVSAGVPPPGSTRPASTRRESTHPGTAAA